MPFKQHERLFQLYSQQILTDVVLVLEKGTRFQAHRVLLAASSPFFYALFTSGMRESHTQEVSLHDLDEKAFGKILEYIYTGELQFTGDIILSLLHTANQLEMTDIVELCAKQLMVDLNISSCLNVFLCVELLQMQPSCRLLAHAAVSMIDDYFLQIINTDAFVQLNLIEVEMILSRPNLCYEKEQDLFQAALKWTQYDFTTRQAFLPSLVNFLGIEQPSFENITSPITTLSSYITLSSTSTTSSQHTRRFVPTLFAIGGFNGPSALRSVEFYDFISNQWLLVASMHEKRSYCASAVDDSNRIFVFGGTSNCRHLSSVEVFNPRLNKWTLVPSMKRPRSYFSAVYLCGFMYAMGGFNGTSHTCSVERFNLRTRQWEEIASLHVGRSGLAAVVVHNEIYVMGGYDGRRHLKSIEKYDPLTNEWQLLTDMQCPRNGPAAVVCTMSNQEEEKEEEASILVFGGETRHGDRLKSAEKYNLKTKEWTFAPSFVDSRSGHAASMLCQNSFVFATGGSNRKDEYLDKVHRYDELTKEWSLHSKMTTQRCGLNLVVVGLSPYGLEYARTKKGHIQQKRPQLITTDQLTEEDGHDHEQIEDQEEEDVDMMIYPYSRSSSTTIATTSAA